MKQLKLRFRVLTLLVIGLLFVAGAYGVYSVSAYGNRWVSSTRNTRYRSAKRSVSPGDIIDRNGVTVATTDENGERVYQSNILSRSSLVHLLGDDEGNIANGVESFQANYLLGFETSLTERVNAFLKGETRKGDSIMITADSKLHTEIVQIFRNTSNTKGKCGAAVVMNYKTGEVLALVSLPVYDPQNITATIKNSTQHPFWNRAVQSTLPPGSTFKIITAVAMLENMADAQTHVFNCTGATQVMDQVITDYGNDQHGEITLEKAFRLSCNNCFAQAALLMGDSALRKTAENFGFNDNFLFRDLVVENSSYPTKDRNNFEIAWSGAGQSKVAATPLHLCMISAAIANDGVMMEPRLLSRVQSPAGVVRLRYSQKAYRTACSPETAKIIDGYMKTVVKSGTGTRAKVDGLTIAGKTGSAEGSANGLDVTHAWFTGYIDDDRYPYAVSVLVEAGGTGGSVAAPVAQKIFEYLRDNAAVY
ncbi:MAG: penicillin-binding protein 2 [Clostridia bacterium]|nr:penicillin-binding protein 2 [Clostridia bacterium]